MAERTAWVSGDMEFLRETLEGMNEGLQIIDPDWRYRYLNPAAADHGRAQRENLLGRTMMECYPGIEKTEMFRTLERCMKEGRTARLENQFRYPDGKERWFELEVEQVKAGILIRSIDVTDRKEAEGRYFHIQKMDAIGRLAGGVAHDFNNNLSAIMMFLDLMQDRIQEDQKAKDYMASVLLATKKAAALTRQLLTFSRKHPVSPEILDLNEVISESEKLFERVLGDRISIRCTRAKELGRIRVDPSQLDQVVLNLIVNARDAMRDGGKLIVETGNVELDEDYATRHPGVAPGRYVMLSVSDTGIGMDKQTLNRLFEPFFTTKKEGEGTGLGLATVHGIVRQAGGHIWVYSEQGAGSTFKVYFPAATEAETVAAPKKTHHGDLSGTETILVVEDDPLVREGIRIALEENGYKVLVAESAKGAIKTFDSSQGAVDALLTDIVMPGMSGTDLAELLKGRKGDLGVIYMSGYTEQVLFENGRINGGAISLQKPINRKQLLQALRGLLDQ